jgi:D-glycerate 3-kinase
MLQSANAGLGDRADPSQWTKIEGPVKVESFPSSTSHRALHISGSIWVAWIQYVEGSKIGFEQVVLFEGWMLGFEPQEESVVTAVDPQVCKWFFAFTSWSWVGCFQMLVSYVAFLFRAVIWCVSVVQLAPVNRNLEAYYDAWHKLIDSWVVIEVDDPNWVFRWRLQVIDAC